MKTTVLLSFLCLTFSLFSQEWKEFYENNAVKIEYKEISYEQPSNKHQHQRIVFKYTNKTNSDLTLRFSREHHYGSQCYGCNAGDLNFTIKLKENSTISFNADNSSKAFYIFKKDLEGYIKRELSDWTIKNIQIE